MLWREGTPIWDWEEAKQRFPVGRLVTGTVTSHHPFGVFVDLKDPGATGLVQVPEFLDGGRMTAGQYPPVGTAVTTGVLGHTDPNRRQVWLTMRPSHLRLLGPEMTESEWQAWTNPVPMLECLRGAASERKLRLFACGCEREYLRFRPDQGDGGIVPRLIEATERYVDGAATFEQWDAVRSCVHGMFHATDPHFHASHASEGAESAAGWHRHPADGNPNYPQRLEQLRYQSDLLREIFGNPFRPVTFSSDWRTDTTVPLAHTMYESQDFSAMAILADALQDAGCDDEAILTHCRGPGPHIRGCWVVDLVLAKE
jgi:hypothetical protein